MQDLGIFFEAKILFLLDWIKQDNIGPALAAVISFVGVVIIGVSWVQTIRESNLIRKARGIIGNRTDEDFARNFNTISQDLSSIPKIQIAWNEFSETLIAPTFDDNRRMLKPCSNTQRPQAYFNFRELEIGPDFAKVFPSVFVGVGLSLTFLGLISALGEAVNSISASSGDTTSMQNAISNLLKISSAKFYASLFALFMSVVMTIALRLMTWKLNGALQGLNRSIEKVVRFLTPEQLALEANDLMRNQLGQLQIFNTDLAMKIGEQVQSSLNQSLAPVIQKLDSMGGDLTQQNIDSIRAIGDEVSRSIQGATAGSMDRVAATLDNISEKLGRLSETLSGALSNFDTEFRQMLEGLKNSLQESTKGVADGIGESMNQMASGIGETATEVSKIINGLTTTVSSLATAGAEISKQGGEELKRQVEAATQIASEQMAQAGRELSAGFKDSTEGLVSALSAATSQLTRLEASLVGLPQSLDAVNTRLGVSATQVGEASNQFGIASSGIRSMVEPLAQYAADTKEAITAVTQIMQDVSNKVGQSSESINNAVASLDSAISTKLAQLEKGDEQLATLLTGIEDSTERVLTKVNEFVTEVDRGFSLSVTKLNDSINALEEVINNINQAISNSR
jgi:hypothetical protein